MVFVYGNWFSNRWQRSVNLYKAGKRQLYTEVETTHKTTQKTHQIENKHSKQDNKHKKNIKKRKSSAYKITKGSK